MDEATEDRLDEAFTDAFEMLEEALDNWEDAELRTWETGGV